MSFFGFDTNLPKDRPPGQGSKGIFENTDPFAEVARAHRMGEADAIDFEDTYDGLGDRLEEGNDDFNQDTFGDAAGSEQQPVGKDFDFFGNTAQMANVMGEEQVLYSLNNRQEMPAPVERTAPQPKRTGYEPYQDPGYIPDLQAKSSVWGDSQKAAPSVQQPAAAPAPARKVMSLEEVEAQMQAQRQKPPMSAEQSGAPPFPFPPPHPHLEAAGHLPSHAHPPPQGVSNLPQVLPRPGPPHHDHPPPPPPPDSFVPHPPPEASLHEFPPLDQQPGRHGQFGREDPGMHQGQQPRPQAPPGIPPPGQQPQTRPPHMRQQPPPQRQPIPGQAPYQQSQQHQQQPAPQQQMGGVGQRPPSGPPSGMHPDFAQMSDDQRQAYLAEDAKRAKRIHKINLLSKGNGFMTPQDKNFITRIQLQQLVAASGSLSDSDSETLISEDFYYQVFSQIRGAPRQHPRQPLGHFAQTYLSQTSGRSGANAGRKQLHHADNHMQRMQQQVQRAVEAAKLRPKNKQLIIEGSLGKISFSNAKTPKPLLNIKRPESSEGLKPANLKKATDSSMPSASDRKSIMLNIERAYGTLMKIEDHERNMPPAPDEGDPEAVQQHMEWRQEMKALNDRLWSDIRVLDPIVPAATATHPFIAFLSFPKGKKVIPRIFRHIDQEQKVTILTMIIVHLDSLDVVKNAELRPGEAQPPVAVREEIELFSHAVMPGLLGYVNEAPMNVIIGLLGLVIAQTNVEQVSKTKVGLGILTMLLSRAELVKESGTASDEDWKLWTDQYNRLFDRLEPVLSDIFPGTINSGDDMYVWQFLAAVGVGASPEQQQRLVIAVKDRVMETVAQSKTLPADMASQRLGNVNLFMRAIGLDVELLE